MAAELGPAGLLGEVLVDALLCERRGTGLSAEVEADQAPLADERHATTITLKTPVEILLGRGI